MVYIWTILPRPCDILNYNTEDSSLHFRMWRKFRTPLLNEGDSTLIGVVTTAEGAT